MLVQLSFFWACKPCWAQEGGQVWPCTYSSCVEEPLQQALVVVGVPRLAGAVTARAAQGQRVPQGARLLPQLPRAQLGAVGTGETHQCARQAPGDGDSFTWVWAVLAPPGAQPWASLRDTWGNIPVPRGKEWVGPEGQPGWGQSLQRSVQTLPKGNEMQIKCCPAGFWESWRLQIAQPLWATNSWFSS